MKIFKCFYLDEPLSSEDEVSVLEGLVHFGEIDDVDSGVIEYCRVASVFSADTFSVSGSNGLIQTIELFRKHLRNAGATNLQQQPLWIMPKETGRGAIFQMSFYEETGFYPYVAQRWQPTLDGELEPLPVRLIDGQGFMRMKDKSPN